MLGVTVIYHVIGDTGKDWAFPVWNKDKNGSYEFSVIYQDDKFQLFRNSTALPRAKIFYEYEVYQEKEIILDRLFSSEFDYRNILILEETPDLKQSKNTKKGNVKIVQYSPNKVIIDVESSHPGLLFLSDNYYPSWKALVNKREAKIFRADYSLRAVVIPKGISKVEFYIKEL